MKRIFALGALVAALAGVAQAQTTSREAFSVRAGLFVPTDSNTNDDAGTGFPAFGVDYRLLELKPGATRGYRSGIGVSVDYYGRSGYTNVPVLVNYIGELGNVFYDAGIGVGFAQTPGETKTRFAYQIGAGYTFTNLGTTQPIPLFGEVKFFGTDDSRLNGFGFYLGVRF